MLLLFNFILFFAAASLLASSTVDSCQCFEDQSYPSSVAAVTIGSPTTTGTFSGTSCPANCSTTITFTGTLDNGLLAGANITFANCNGLANSSYLTVNNITFNSCPSNNNGFMMSITNTNVFTFVYQLSAPVNLLIVLQPTPQISNPSTITPSPSLTTPIYSGPFPFNPAISTIDLTIGLDINQLNKQFFNQTREMIENIVKYFTYSSKYVRLSLLAFDPYGASDTGKYPLWGHTAETVDDYLNNLPFFPGSSSDYATSLEEFFFPSLNVSTFALRPNVERIFISFTGTDSKPINNQTAQDIQNKIDYYDIKFIFVNVNTSIATQNGLTNNYPELSKITGKNSNKQHWFDYQLNSNNAENFLISLYFDGNKLCNLINQNVSVVLNANPIKYSILQDPTKLYCNYMENVQTYSRVVPTNIIRLTFTSFEVNENTAIRIGLDGKEMAVLTNNEIGTASYCLNGDVATVTFESYDGFVYAGSYQSEVKVDVNMNSCQSAVG